VVPVLIEPQAIVVVSSIDLSRVGDNSSRVEILTEARRGRNQDTSYVHGT
jgi:hypothetical protein